MRMCTLMYSHRKAPSFSFKKKDKSIETYVSGLCEPVGKLFISVATAINLRNMVADGSQMYEDWSAAWCAAGASDSVAPLAPYPAAWERLQIIGGQGKATEYSVLAPH